MKTLIILCLWGTSLSLPVWPNRLLSASNSRELVNTGFGLPPAQIVPDHTTLQLQQDPNQQMNPGFRLPPAQLVPDHSTLQLQQDPNQDPHLHPTFRNLPVISGYQQLIPSINLIPLTSLMAPGQDIQPVNPSAGGIPMAQTLPIMIGGINALPQMLPPQPMYPIIVAQFGQQDMMVSSEEMENTFFTGIFMPPFLPGLLPVGQAGVSVDGQDTVIAVDGDEAIPAGQTGANTPVLGTATSAVSDGIHNEQEMFVTAPAGVRKSGPEGDIIGEGNGDRFSSYTTPAGFIKPFTESGTNVIFVEPTALVDMAPREPNIVPYSELNVPRNGKVFYSHISQGQKLSAPVRGDDHLPVKATDAKLLRNHKKSRV